MDDLVLLLLILYGTTVVVLSTGRTDRSLLCAEEDTTNVNDVTWRKHRHGMVEEALRGGGTGYSGEYRNKITKDEAQACHWKPHSYKKPTIVFH